MAIAGLLGLQIDLKRAPVDTAPLEALLFAETPGRFLVEVAPEHADPFERLFGRLPHARIGEVLAEPQVTMRLAERTHIDLPLETIEQAWRSTL